MKRLIFLIFIAAMMALVLPCYAQKTWYLSTCGDSATYNPATDLCTGGSDDSCDDISDLNSGGNCEPSAGDIIEVRAGTYTEGGDPVISLSVGSLTIRGYSGDATPVFSMTPSGSPPSPSNRPWVVGTNDNIVSDLIIRATQTATARYEKLLHVTGDKNTFTNVTFDGTGNTSNDKWNLERTMMIASGADYNVFDSCTFSESGDYETTCDTGDTPRGGVCSGGGGITVAGQYNRIIDSAMDFMGTHEQIEISNAYNEFIGNTFTRTAGYAFYVNSGDNIFEGNSITQTDYLVCSYKSGFYYRTSDFAIYRYNNMYDGDSAGMEWGHTGTPGLTTNLFMFNNVFYKLGQEAYDCATASDCTNNDQKGWFWTNNNATNLSSSQLINNVAARNTGYDYLGCYHYGNGDQVNEVYFYAGIDQVQMENNAIFTYDNGGYVSQHVEAVGVGGGANWSVSAIDAAKSNWKNNIGTYSNPYWNDADNGDFTITNAASSLVDQGRELTTITTAGSTGTSFTLAEARFFWVSPIDANNTNTGTSYTGDQIIINSDTSKVVTLATINYSTGAVTFAPSVTWSTNDTVSIYKTFSDSSTVRYSGTAPDIGSFEYSLIDPTGGVGAPSELSIP